MYSRAVTTYLLLCESTNHQTNQCHGLEAVQPNLKII